MERVRIRRSRVGSSGICGGKTGRVWIRGSSVGSFGIRGGRKGRVRIRGSSVGITGCIDWQWEKHGDGTDLQSCSFGQLGSSWGDESSGGRGDFVREASEARGGYGLVVGQARGGYGFANLPFLVEVGRIEAMEAAEFAVKVRKGDKFVGEVWGRWRGTGLMTTSQYWLKCGLPKQ